MTAIHQSNDENSMSTVAAAGESGVLAAILGVLGEYENTQGVRIGPGDDSAVLGVNGDLVITTDAMVEGPDFTLAWSSGFELGWKLAASNLSDLAAMGAWPRALTVTVLAPPQTTVTFLEDVARGLAEACAVLAPGTSVVGGDLSRSHGLGFSVTAVGEMRHTAPVTRSGAKAGDVVAYAGDLGLAGAGLRLLHAAVIPSSAEATQRLAELWQEHPEELAAHLAPSPPLSLGPVAAAAGATAMMDVSDSLSLDASRLGRASGVTLNLSEQALREKSPAVTLDDILFGGEDHGLLATFPPGSKIPEGFTAIGDVQARSAEVMLDLVALVPRGWDPFRS